MDWALYQKRFKISAKKNNYSDEFIKSCLDYAKVLFDNGVPIIYDNEHLSRLLGYTKEYLFYVTNEPQKSYRVFQIPKHNGKLRTISEPFPDLKNIQTWILRNILEKNQISVYAKAYKNNCSIVENVKYHVNQNVIIKLDVSNFFPSIKQRYISKLFIKMGYSHSLSGLLSRLCCFENCLPQGAPTSPYLSNLYCKNLDKRIGKYITKIGYRYTRYADDITISGNISDKQIGTIIRFCKKCLNDINLSLNDEKTKILRKNNRQFVTGVILNSKLSAGTKKKKEIRKEIYYIKKYGLESHIDHKNIIKQNYIYHLAGLINWVLSLEKDNKEFLEYKEFIRNIIKGNNNESSND